MDSQGRSRFIVVGLSLAAVLLVISLLLTQQDSRIPVVPDSPLVGDGTGTPSVEASQVDDEPSSATRTPDVEPDSQRDTFAPESPLVSPEGATRAGVGVSAGVSVTAQSTVTVTLAAPMATLYEYAVVATYPHDPDAFTQGLQYVDGVLYEGTGLNGRSSLRRVDLVSGVVEQQIRLPDEYFGEGIYVLEDRIFQLTWKSGVAFVYDRESFAQLDQFGYPTEGWGLAYDGKALLMSDGSATIVRRSPEDFSEVGRFTVLQHGAPVNRLNELEYIEGELWANVWQTDDVVIINPLTGNVTGRVDFAGLLPAEDAVGVDVLNGIAYDDVNDRIFVTGKLWPTLFEIQIIRRDAS